MALYIKKNFIPFFLYLL